MSTFGVGPNPYEKRVTNPTTGGEKGQKLARFDLVPTYPLTVLAEHFGKGAEKYEDRNWEKGVAWSLSYAALLRHITAWWGGEESDEDGNLHLAAVMWHACALIEYRRTHPELDDRPNSDPPMADVIDIKARLPKFNTAPQLAPRYFDTPHFRHPAPADNDGMTSYGREARG